MNGRQVVFCQEQFYGVVMSIDSGHATNMKAAQSKPGNAQRQRHCSRVQNIAFLSFSVQDTSESPCIRHQYRYPDRASRESGRWIRNYKPCMRV